MIGFPHTVIILRAGVETDQYGDSRPDWPNAAQTPSPGWVQPVSSVEDVQGRQTVVAAWRVFLPPKTDVLPTDRILWQARTFEVNGEPAAWDVGQLAHLEVQLKHITG